MKAVEVNNRKTQKKFLDFRKKIYKNNPVFVDNNLFMIKELFARKTSFTDNKEIFVYNIEENNVVLCQGDDCVYRDVAGVCTIMLFESEPDAYEAVKLLVDKAVEIGTVYGCEKLVIGLNGHVNYGLGFLNSDYDEKNSFSSSVNPEYYNTYFRQMNCDEINLNTYKIDVIDNRLDRYQAIINKINRNYTFKYFDKKQFDYYSRIYTDLNNICFAKHRYYYGRNYAEDKEMLKELFLFMKEDSLIFAFDDDKPVGFIMWYPDFNELAKQGEAFGAKHFIKNIFLNKKIKTAKIMEFGILEEYRSVGLPIALIHQIFLSLPKYNITKVDTSWILEENKDSNSVCRAICDDTYKRFVVYEKELNNDLKVFHSTSFDEMVLNKKMPYPFDRELINLLKQENRFGQEYYYIESGSDYAFFIVYKNKMNIFTFGKWKCNFNLNVVGFPCSLSNCGYVTNNEKMMLDYIRTIKGAVLVLNVDNPIDTDYMTIGATLPTCIFNNRFETVEEYLGSLRSSYRRRINLARKACKDIEIRDASDSSADIYQLYLNTYNKSDYKLEKLEKGFFNRVDAHKIAFFKGAVPVGFVLLKQVEDRLIFMLCGMNYDYDTTDLYYYMLFYIVEYAINNKCRVIDFGQTSEATKMKFGAVLEEKYFYARHSNFILNGFVKLCKGLLEYKYSFPKFRVFREDLE